MRSFLRSAGIATAVAALLLSAACSGSTAGSATNATTGNPPAASGDSAAGTSQGAPSSLTVPTARQKQFGQSYEWEDDLSVTVSEPVFFVPGTYASVQPANGYLKFAVSITNNSVDVYEPNLFSATVQSGNEEGDPVFDIDNDLMVSPSTAILPGRQSTFDVGFSVDNPLDVVMEVSPGFDYDHAFFVTSPGSVPASAAAPAAPAPAEPEPSVPTDAAQSISGDLGLTAPIMNPACDGTGIVLLFASVTPGAYATEIQQALDSYPGSFYLRTDQSCSSLNQATESGDPIYAVYRYAGDDRADVCVVVNATGGGAYGKWLDNTTDPDVSIDC